MNFGYYTNNEKKSNDTNDFIDIKGVNLTSFTQPTSSEFKRNIKTS